MKVIIEGQAFFDVSTGLRATDDDASEVKVELVGHPDEELETWAVLIVHPKFSLKVDHEELRRALRVFETRRREPG